MGARKVENLHARDQMEDWIRDCCPEGGKDALEGTRKALEGTPEV